MPGSSTNRQGSRGIVGALALVGTVCVAYPLVDLLLNNWPFLPAQLAWRYQVVGMLSQLLVTPFIGLVFLMGAAVLTGARTWLRAGAWLAMVASLLLVAVTVVFFMDAGGLADVIPADDRDAFTYATARAVLKNGVSAVVLFVLGILGLRAASAVNPRAGRSSDREELVGT